MNDIVTSCVHVTQQLEPGHSESVYQNALAINLASKGWITQCERPAPILFTDITGTSHIVGTGRIDIYATKSYEDQTSGCQVNMDVIIEIKVSTTSVSKPWHRQQVEAYAKHVPGIPVLITFTSANWECPIIEAKPYGQPEWVNNAPR